MSSTAADSARDAIRDFLRHAYHYWQPPAPTYVLLIGDANQDDKDNLQTATANYVPSKNIESELFGEVSTDNWYAAVSGEDKLPDLFIGVWLRRTSVRRRP